MKQHYLESISLIERLHRLFLEVIKAELDALKIEDINNVQAMVLYNLGEDKITIGELTTKGCYLGSNVSYNLKKMVQSGYIEQMNSKRDKRSFIIKLSHKGSALCKKIDEALDRHIASLQKDDFGGMEDLVETLRKLEYFWGNSLNHRVRFGI